MTIFVRGCNPIWSLVDLTGHQFDDTFYMFVLENTIPYIPSTVYHDVSGTIPWNNPIQFLANGTLPVDIYWNPDLVYRLEFRQGDTQTDPLIYEVNNYSPGGSGITPVDTSAIASDNQITNPQFSLINFTSPYSQTSITNPDPIEVAPGWFLKLAGTGNVALERIALTATQANETNAPYALRITLSGSWSATPYLYQRFEQNGMLWSTFTRSRYVASSITAKVDGAPQSILAQLYDSMGTALTTVLDDTILNGTYNEYTGSGLMPSTTNTNTPPAAYIEYRLFLPTSVDLYVTSFQLVSTLSNFHVQYIQETIERQIDHTFHYYKPPLFFKPIPSLLTGWDFPLNPAQMATTASTSSGNITTTPGYIWDQTIAVCTGSNLAYARDTVTGGLQVTTAGAVPNAFLLCQYLSGKEAKKILGTKLSCNLFGYRGSAGGAVTFNIYLFRGSSSAVIPALPNLIGSLAATGVFTKNSTAGQGQNWTEIARTNLQGASGTLSTVTANVDLNSDDNDYGFSGWEITDNTELGDTDKFCIITTFSYAAASTVITTNSISVVPGLIPTRPAPQTAEDVLADCEYYYETSFDIGTTVPTATFVGFLSYLQDFIDTGGNQSLLPRAFTVPFRTPKIAIPSNFVTYSGASTTAGNIEGYIIRTTGNTQGEIVLSTYWALVEASQKSIVYRSISATPALSSASSGTLYDAFIGLHYIADSRLGV